MIRPLEAADIRAIVQAHPATFAKIASADGATIDDVSAQMTQAIMGDPALVRSIVSAGTGMAVEAVGRMGALTRWLTALQIVMATSRASDPQRLAAVLFEEIADLAFPPMETLQ